MFLNTWWYKVSIDLSHEDDHLSSTVSKMRLTLQNVDLMGTARFKVQQIFSGGGVTFSCKGNESTSKSTVSFIDIFDCP